MKRLLLVAWLSAIIIPLQMQAQDLFVSGKVTEQGGSALPGANVVIKGTTMGTATDANGEYKLKVSSPNDVLVYSSIGMVTQETQVGNKTVINITLEVDVKQLSEVVVTAIGIERNQKALGYAVQEVGGDALVQSREANVVNALAGKVAGVQINNSGGQPGASSRITIRGNSSVLGNNQPLFVIDGIPVDNSQVFGGGQLDENGRGTGDNPLFTGSSSNRGIDIDPNVIEEISVLKGAAASALYGSRAANGVILITTKKGKDKSKGLKPSVGFSTVFGWDEAYTDGYQDKYLQGLNGLYRNGKKIGEGGYSEEGPGINPQSARAWGPHRDSVSQEVIDSIGMPRIYDPRKAFYKTGKTYNNSINLSGANETFNYFLSFSDWTQEGIVPGTELKRNTVLTNFGVKLSDKIDVSTSFNYTKTKNKWLPEGNGSTSFLYGLNFTPISYDITDYKYPDGSGKNFTPTGTGFNNPFWLAENNGLSSDVDRFISNVTLNIRLLPWLKITERVGIDTYLDTRKERMNVGTIGRSQGSMYDENIHWREINNDLIVTAEKAFDKFNASLLIGNNLNSRVQQRELQRGTGLSIPGFFNIQNATAVTALEYLDRRRLVGFYGQANIDYNNFLYLTLTGRNDWTSTLPSNNRSYFYPSASLGFIFTQVLGLSNSNYFPYGKLRLSYAEIGNDAPSYSLTTTYSQSQPGDAEGGQINYPYQGVNGFELSNVQGNPNLRPERTKEVEVGLDLHFLNNRFNIDAAYYKRRTVDQIFSVPVSAGTGFLSRLTNSGEISNEGLELVVSGTPLKIGDFAWDFLVTYTRNRSKVVELAPGVETIRLGGFTNPGVFIKAGEDYGVIWGQGFKRNAEGVVLINEEGLPVIADELGAIGNILPDWTGGIRNTFSYKGISLSALIDIRQGGDLMNLDYTYTTFYGTAKVTEQRNTTYTYKGNKAVLNEQGEYVDTGVPNDISILRDQAYWQNFYSTYDENFVEDASFVKLRELSLAYSVPSNLLSKTPFKSVRVSATGRNIWIKSDFSYKDPEGSLYGSANAQGFYHAVTPATKSFTVGLNVSF